MAETGWFHWSMGKDFLFGHRFPHIWQKTQLYKNKQVKIVFAFLKESLTLTNHWQKCCKLIASLEVIHKQNHGQHTPSAIPSVRLQSVFPLFGDWAFLTAVSRTACVTQRGWMSRCGRSACRAQWLIYSTFNKPAFQLLWRVEAVLGWYSFLCWRI